MLTGNRSLLSIALSVVATLVILASLFPGIVLAQTPAETPSPTAVLTPGVTPSPTPVQTPIATLVGEPTQLTKVWVSFYPEYDDLLKIGAPSLLVMLDGQILGATLPATVRFLVPTQAILYSAGSGPRTQYQGGPPARKTSDLPGWDEISFELKTDIFVVEYYLPIQSTPDKDIAAEFIPLYPVQGLNAVIQQPSDSTNFKILPLSEPATQQPSTTSEGLRVVTYTYPAVGARQPLQFGITYTRTSQTPTQGDNTNDSNTNSVNPMMIVGIVVIAVIVIGFLLYYVLSKSPAPRNKGRGGNRPTKGGKAAASGRQAISGQSRFCHSCGARMSKDDQFCPKCGAKQRPE